MINMFVTRMAGMRTWILFLAVCSQADTYIRQPSVDIIHYDISLKLIDESDLITGTTKIQVLIRNNDVSGMWLDFEGMDVDALLVQGIKRSFVHRDGRLSFDFDKTYSRSEIVVVEVHYHGRAQNPGMQIQKNKYGRRVFFTDDWPDFAHHWFPSIDHPSDKATVDIQVTAPERYDVVSNGRIVKTLSLLDGRKVTQWSEDKAIPTYSVAIGVAEFSAIYQPDLDCIQLVWYSYPQDSEAAAQKFGMTAAALSYFDSLIGPYPYNKLAQVQSTTRMGGMENASAVFYSESSFQKTPVIESTVPHEIAHQWFGDSVTPADWDHLWLSEGFATYFSALFYEHLYGTGSLKQIMDADAKKLDAYSFARSAPIIDPSQTDLMDKLNPLNYEKGAWILHMLRGILGDADFFEGIRSYYRLYKDGNALSEDFQKVMESVSGISLNTFFRQWLYQPGWPQYGISWQWDETKGEVKLSVRQTQTTGLFDMPLNIVFTVGNQREALKFRIVDKVQEFRIPLRARPSSLEIDPEGWVLKTIDWNTSRF
jgi:aminopeptidase N